MLCCCQAETIRGAWGVVNQLPTSGAQLYESKVWVLSGKGGPSRNNWTMQVCARLTSGTTLAIGHFLILYNWQVEGRPAS